ncbi:hypothetical protein LCGC14_3134890 [marine sediment metagenome]|uniref:Uncharacterized protein n=1 Tax=marine sediment metagenome TaxID=412755 RepID=A0A0F8Y5N2_9ZZZZ
MRHELRYLLDDLKIINKALDDPTILSMWYQRYHKFRSLTLSLIRVELEVT